MTVAIGEETAGEVSEMVCIAKMKDKDRRVRRVPWGKGFL
jgi:hypothetical protein